MYNWKGRKRIVRVEKKERKKMVLEAKLKKYIGSKKCKLGRL